ncbi:N-acetyltransferase family protein [Hymenobacter sp. 15J16-1T3B]|uniref:GNAT family N-acetyltransferase n=1 Tax=Hymenobacter sp. 15J16-1T3B TaxID=2886941 RepID=UPI001D11C109|nr:GNAT family N-acetyltransferase [Hymenobacter sp. 15J16-1T3B]MCC3158672.1 N-acetyltransferase family protein [Hymenobacter sp. 15J16-1T3B]
MTISPLTEAHWPDVRAIYEAGIATGNATFTTEAPSWDEWHRGHLAHSRLVALDDAGRVLGWAALSPVSGRCVYGGVAEVSVYVAAAARGQGVGRALLLALIAESEAQGMWTLQAGIFPENEPSVRLHEAAGFRLVGRRERIGRMGNRWRDTLLLERRSALVGADPETASAATDGRYH